MSVGKIGSLTTTPFEKTAFLEKTVGTSIKHTSSVMFTEFETLNFFATTLTVVSFRFKIFVPVLVVNVNDGIFFSFYDPT